ncbi:DNA-directed RNA polymerase subunit alpha C-terminal domain-containing protein [Spirillospora sp. NPDC127200]
MHTVGDLLNALTAAGQTIQNALPTPNEHDEITPACPLRCLGLPPRPFNALRWNTERKPRTVGDVLSLLESCDLGEVRNMGTKSVEAVQRALLRAGFTADRYPALASIEPS